MCVCCDKKKFLTNVYEYYQRNISVKTRNTCDYSIHSITSNAQTEIKERICRETQRAGERKKKKKKKSSRACTLVFLENSHRSLSPIRLAPWRRDGNICRYIIGISAPGRIKSGRRDQWLTRIVGALRKIPYLHTKIRARARLLARSLARLLSRCSPFFPLSFSPFSVQSAGAR